ncbi:MAG: heavy-metal-associated domain-containing protein [Cyanobacteria bacterium J06642_2]
MSTTHLTLTVPKLACSACVETVTAAVRACDARAQVNADPNTKQVEIELSAHFVDATDRPEASVRQAMTDAGYPPT